MHMYDLFAAGPLMQIVDVLCDQEKVARKLAFQSSQGNMSCVGKNLRRQQLASPLVIKLLHQRRVPGKGFGRGDILHPMIVPESIAGAKRLNS